MLLLWRSESKNSPALLQEACKRERSGVALSFKTRSAERKTHLDKSTVRCNNHHNMTVLETACEGELIVVRRPSSGQPCSTDDFLPCSMARNLGQYG